MVVFKGGVYEFGGGYSACDGGGFEVVGADKSFDDF